MSDEEIIRRRLMFDGDGTGDDRRLNDLVKNIAKWMKTNHETEEDCQMTFDKILAQLDSVKHSRRLSNLRHKQADKELKKFTNLFNDLEDKIKEKKDEIEIQKKNLDNAKTIKHNRIQYHLLSKSIHQETLRTESQKSLESLQSAIAEYESQKELLDQRLNTRKKQFNVLSLSANNLQDLLSKENAEGADKATKESKKKE